MPDSSSESESEMTMYRFHRAETGGTGAGKRTFLCVRAVAASVQVPSEPSRTTDCWLITALGNRQERVILHKRKFTVNGT